MCITNPHTLFFPFYPTKAERKGEKEKKKLYYSRKILILTRRGNVHPSIHPCSTLNPSRMGWMMAGWRAT